jgi:hypothetical protein
VAHRIESRIGETPVLRTVLVSVHLCGVAGAFALALNLVLAGRPWTGLSLAACASLLAVASWGRAVSRLRTGRLIVDAAGAAFWQDHACREDEAPFRPLCWHSIGPLAWIDGMAGHRRVRLLIGADLLPDTDRRRLLAWLRWMDRGGASREHAPGREPLELSADAPISA